MTETFICPKCQCELTLDYSLRTEGYCYLCDPAISLAELLANEPIRPFQFMDGWVNPYLQPRFNPQVIFDCTEAMLAETAGRQLM